MADAKAARRMLTLALVMEVEMVDRRTAVETCEIHQQTLRDWGYRYNAQRLEGLSNRRSAKPTPRLGLEQKAVLARMSREGPDPA